MAVLQQTKGGRQGGQASRTIWSSLLHLAPALRVSLYTCQACGLSPPGSLPSPEVLGSIVYAGSCAIASRDHFEAASTHIAKYHRTHCHYAIHSSNSSGRPASRGWVGQMWTRPFAGPSAAHTPCSRPFLALTSHSTCLPAGLQHPSLPDMLGANATCMNSTHSCVSTQVATVHGLHCCTAVCNRHASRLPALNNLDRL